MIEKLPPRDTDFLRKTKFFTLLELLIVVAIIAILAGLLLPALSAAREKAKTIQCVNNFDSIGNAALLYAADYDDWLPPGSNGDPGSVSGTQYPRFLGTGEASTIAVYLACERDPPFIGQVTSSARSRFTCPADTLKNYHYTIAYNHNLNNTDQFELRKLNRWKRPTRSMLAMGAESSDVHFSVGTFAFRHNARTNVLFGDGHVNTLKTGQIPHNRTGEPGYVSGGYRAYFWFPYSLSPSVILIDFNLY